MDEHERLRQTLADAWQAGCPVAGATDESRDRIAQLAARRWRSQSHHLAVDASRRDRVRDLATGLAAQLETNAPGPLMRDYEFLAEALVDAFAESS